MRIVHVFKDFYPPLPAGITCYLHDIAEETARRGHEVEVHVAGVASPRSEELAGGVVVHRHVEWARLLSSPLSPALVNGIRRARADVLHVHMPNPAGELGALLNADHVPIVASFHARLGRQRFLEPVYGPMRRRLLRTSSAILASSAAMSGVPELAAGGAKVRVLPYGVSPRRVARLPHDRNGQAERLRVLFVGRLVYYKGLDVLVRAVAALGGVALTIVGDGPLRAHLGELVADLRLQESVRLAGCLTDHELRAAYAGHDVFVLPSVSRAEAFGIAMAEAMASGLPVVSTELRTGTSWVNLDGVSGFVIPPGDSGALARALRRLRSHEVRAVLGAGARARAEELFSFDRHCEGLLEVYEEVLRRV